MREVPVEVRSHPRKHINMCASKGPRLCVIIINRGGVGESAVKDHLFRPWQSSKNMCTPTKIKSILVMKGRLSEWLRTLATVRGKKEHWFGLRHFANAPLVAPQFVPSLLARLALSLSSNLRRGATAPPARAAQDCHRRNLSFQRADQQSRPPPLTTEATGCSDLNSSAALGQNA